MSGPRIGRRPLLSDPAMLTGIPPLLARLYAARGVASNDQAKLELGGLLPVGSLAGSAAAVDVLLEHHAARSRVIVVGDFDADGATSSALVVRALRALGFADVDFLVPNRFEFGYGLSPPLVEVAAASRPGLLITVDNGISSVRGVAAAREKGIDVLVTDHHLPPDVLPAARAIVNPNLPDEPFASKNLAGVGVAFYLMTALAGRLTDAASARRLAASLLDLVALGTVADVVPLDRNNRILVEHGLRRIRSARGNPGIRALLEMAGRNPSSAVASDLGFAAGPRLNAAGRLDDMGLGIRCLLAGSPAEARPLALTLDQLNQARRSIESEMQTQALEAVSDTVIEGAIPVVLCLFDEGWHQGVVGLVAGRIKERYHRPVVAFALDADGRLKGSARSIPGLHIRDVLAEVDSAHPDLIERFGGHAMAAGLTLERTALAPFADALLEVVSRHLSAADLNQEILTDGGLGDPELNLETAELLRAAGPWGQGFPEPLFEDLFEICSSRVLKDRHLKLQARLPAGHHTLDALAFNQAGLAPDPLPARLRLVYRLDVNEFRGVRSPQLIVEHMAAE